MTTEAATANGSTRASAQKAQGKSRALGYAVLFLASFLFFLLLTFPFDILLGGAIKNLEASLSPAMRPMKYDSMRIALPLGASFKDLQFGSMPDGNPLVLLDALTVKASPIAAIRGNAEAALKADLYGGKAVGAFRGTQNAGRLDLKVVGLSLEKAAFVKNSLKMNLLGKLTLQASMDWNKVWQDNAGNVVFSIQDGVAKEVNIKIMTTDFVFSKVEGDLTIGGGQINVNKIVLEGTPCGFELSGTILVNPTDFQASMLDLKVILSPTEELKKKVPFEALQPAEGGKYQAHLGGQIRAPVFP